MSSLSARRRHRYATDPEYRKREQDRVTRSKLKKEFVEWQKKYNREYYLTKIKDQRRRPEQPPQIIIEEMNDNYPDPADDVAFTDHDDLLCLEEQEEDMQENPAETIIYTESQPNYLPVEKANNKSTSYESLEDKVQSHTELCNLLDLDIEYKCRKCLQTSRTIQEAARHAQTHQSQFFSCSHCPIIHTKHTQLVAHTLRDHPGETEERTTIKTISPNKVLQRLEKRTPQIALRRSLEEQLLKKKQAIRDMKVVKIAGTGAQYVSYQ